MGSETAHWAQAPQSEANLSHPIDLQHLSRYTLGDAALEREVLELFCGQSAIYLEELRKASSLEQWRAATHSLKGSAQAIGAWRIAEAAKRAEALASVGSIGPRGACMRELEASVVEANAYIRSLP